MIDKPIAIRRNWWKPLSRGLAYFCISALPSPAAQSGNSGMLSQVSGVLHSYRPSAGQAVE